MKFLKTFNNSAALIENNQGQEEIVLGKGVGFGLKKVILLMKAKLNIASLLKTKWIKLRALTLKQLK